MTVILGPDGMRLDKVTQPMSVDQVKWFLDPDALMQAAPHLWTLSLRLFCLRCWRRGLRDDVRVTFNDATQDYFASCECAKGAGRLPRHEIRKIADTDTLLRKLGWSFSCTARCERGADGVEASNSQTSQTLTVRCGCTTRIHVLAAAPTGLVGVAS